jgi:SAM-dependent methyltransferase
MILRRIKEIRPTANKFLDIGCGVGDLLLDAKKFFSYVEGIEPSKAQCEIGRKRGLNVKNGYFDSTFCGREYDVVVSTQVLGYIDDLTSHIKLLKSVCADYGVGYIEVPNGMKIVRGKIF